MNDKPYVLYEKTGRVVTITLNRPEKLNAITVDRHHEVMAAFRRFDADPEADLAVLKGAGRAFCAGRDITAQAESGVSPTEGTDVETGPYGIPHIDKPIITSCRGHAIGAGGYMAMSGDIRVVSDTFRFALAEVPTAVLGPYWIGEAENLPRTVAFRLAMGDNFSLDELKHWGLVTEVVPDAELDAATDRWVEHVLSLPYQHVLETKKLLRQVGFQYTRDMRKQEFHVRDRLDVLPDTREAALAFAEKRKPNFVHR